MLYKHHACSDICDNEIDTISNMASLEALEILCFIDSFFFIHFLGLIEYSLYLALLEGLGILQ